ncbi:hypothetical protein BKA70DRAFT_1427471 [Coprinopsis sp. MPI-PUGE-AT-0042]|nr:hypothetical protein BKA70DRAFT_1427471 [Coprinopsis sp. MPI-PUGE-AT-0042]
MLSTLVDDVLDSVFKYCGPSTLSIISQASSGTRALAVPHLVRRVNLEDARQAYLFLEFMQRHSPGSPFFPQGIAHHILELRLDFFVLHGRGVFDYEDLEGEPDYPCSQLAPMIASAFTGMTNLRLLEVGSNTEGAMKYSPELARSLLDLPSLLSLTLSDVGMLASGALGQAAGDRNRVSQLQSVQLSPMLSSCHHRPAQPSPYFDRFLSYLSPNVVSLEISNFDLSTLISEVDGPAVVFPSALRLQISPYGSSLQEISNAFPNITNLILESGNPTPRPHCPDTLFPRLIGLTGCFSHISTILRSQTPTGQRREIRCLDFLSETSALPGLLSEVEGLKSLYFDQSPVQPLTWWQRLAETVPRLVLLRLSLTARSLEDLDLIGKQQPPLFSSVPLECITFVLSEKDGILEGLDTAKVASDIALSWATNVPTLRHVLCDIDFGLYMTSTACIYGLEIVRGENGIVELQPIPGDNVAGIRGEYNRWN